MLKFKERDDGYTAESIFGEYDIDVYDGNPPRYEVVRGTGHLVSVVYSLEEAKEDALQDYMRLVEYAAKELGII